MARCCRVLVASGPWQALGAAGIRLQAEAVTLATRPGCIQEGATIAPL